MDILSKVLMEKASVVINLSCQHDVEITFQKELIIKEKIKKINSLFLKEIEKKPNFSFSFGDKYFYKVKKGLFICIPSVANINTINKYIVDKKTSNHIKKDFLNFIKKGQFEGYFDITISEPEIEEEK